ncbi:hypothetical protein KXR87_18130 [Yokenella regensburgei]|uniref:hypothetical protein n=1 Tax=Yokenella regensburgei TaxID=158877 RepID=UPI003F14212D
MNPSDHDLNRSRLSRMTRYRCVQLNMTEAEYFCSLPMDECIPMHIPAFMTLAVRCRHSEGLTLPETTDLLDDIMFYIAMFGLFLETGRTKHPVELVKARYRQAGSDPSLYPALLAIGYPQQVQTRLQG